MCYSLGRKDFDALLGPIEDVWRFEALRKVPVLFTLSEQQLFELAHCMKNHAIAAGQMVFRQGDPGGFAGHRLSEAPHLEDMLFSSGRAVPISCLAQTIRNLQAG